MKSGTLLFALLMVYTGLIAQVNIDQGLIAFYPFAATDLQSNGTIIDHSGLENTINAPGVSFFDEDYRGVLDEAVAVAFPDPSAHLALNESHNNPYIANLQDFSFSFRVISSAPSTFVQGFTPIMTILGQDGDYFIMEFNNSNNKVRFSNYTSEGEMWYELNSVSTIRPSQMNDYHHVSVTLDSRFGFYETRLYINGELEAQTTKPPQLPFNPVIYFGKDVDDEVAEYPMCFDGLHIHNRALNSDEIETLSQGMTTSLEEDLKRQGVRFFMYPNPVQLNRPLHVILNDMAGPVRIEIRSVTGQLISVQELENAENFDLEMPGLKGLYLVNVRIAGRQYTRRVQVH